MNKRDFLKTSGFGLGSLALTGFTGGVVGLSVVPEPACSKKSVEVEVSTAVTFLNKVSSLLPAKAQFIARIVGALGDFNTAYQAGKFDSAAEFLASASTLFEQLVGDLGVNLSPSVKIALAIVDAAISAIAVLLKSQASVPEVVEAMKSAPPAKQKQISVIEKRAAHAEKLFEAIQH